MWNRVPSVCLSSLRSYNVRTSQLSRKKCKKRNIPRQCWDLSTIHKKDTCKEARFLMGCKEKKEEMEVTALAQREVGREAAAIQKGPAPLFMFSFE